MGAYLSEPILDKHSDDESSKCLSFGASSMQGWRVSQEDAHNAILNYCQGKSLFAVYDGHGGHEVAAYCSLKLPDFLKSNENFQKGNYKAALEEAFIEFDATLIDRSVVEQLKKIAGSKDDEAEEEDGEEKDEVKDLFDEAEMPIEDLVAKYSTSPCSAKKEKEEKGEAGSGSGASSLPPHMRNIKAADRKKPVSPFLRGKSSPVDLAGGSNKHIRFNEDGSVIENGVEEDKSDVKEEAVSENGSKDTSVKSENGESETKTEPKEETVDSPQTPDNKEVVNGKNGIEDSPEGSEKENKDINAKVENQSNGDVFDDEGNIVKQPKGKGKGKGKGKSKGKSEDPEPEVKEKKTKKSAEEIYDTLKKAEPEEGDEDSEDSDDMEFGEAEGLDEEDSDEELGEEEEEESDEESEEEDEDDGEEEMMAEAGFNEDPGNDSGCTAVVALLAGTTLYVANAGDSRCVVCRDGKAVEMSFDHKPEDDIEMKRIVNAGGKVTPDGRVNGGLNLSRAIGDHAYKKNESLSLPEQMISPQPDIKTLEINPDTDKWMILACDGIWNFMSSQEVVDYINPKIDNTPEEKLSSICEELFDHCLAPDTMGDGTGCDNMTAVIVKFKQDFKDVKDVTENKTTNGVTAHDEASDSLDSEQPAAKKIRLDTAADPSQ